MISAMEAGSPGAAPAVVPQPRLVKAAHEFEAQMMKELLRPMTHPGAMEEDGDESSSGPMADFASEALGQALSARDGLGIATSIIHSLSRNGTGSVATANSGRLKADSARLTGVGLK
jgi:Rod binding domain-containing protein